MNRLTLLAAIRRYAPTDEVEKGFIDPFILLLGDPRCFHRDHLPGHITGSAWILDQTGTHVVLVKHAKLNRWLQPGGHADGDENVIDVARREAWEETGLKNLALIGDAFCDIDIHRIPARKDFPEHDHYDLRFLFCWTGNEPLKISDESTDLRWVPLDQLQDFNPDPSMIRLKKKSIWN